MLDLACVIHVHSTFSDGTATVAEIIEAAAAAGADVVLLTDHDSLEAARRGLEGWHGDVLLLVGHEVTTRGGHLLVFGPEQEIDHRGKSEADICSEVTAEGGFAVAAHPFSRGGVVPWIIRPHPWSALAECVTSGIELWSLVTDTAERWRTPRQVLSFLRRPEAALDGPPADHMARWDRLCARRRVPAIGGLDAHQSGVRIGGRVLSPMRNKRYFKLLRTHVLVNERPQRILAVDRAAVYDALRDGRCFLGVDALAPTRGFGFVARGRDGRTAVMGAEVSSGRWTLSAVAPRSARLRLLRDGRVLAERLGRSLEVEVERPGSYRVEAWLASSGRERPWIISNPIYVR